MVCLLIIKSGISVFVNIYIFMDSILNYLIVFSQTDFENVEGGWRMTMDNNDDDLQYFMLLTPTRKSVNRHAKA